MTPGDGVPSQDILVDPPVSFGTILVDPPVSFGTILVRWYAGMGPNPCGGFGIYSVLPKNPWVGTHPGCPKTVSLNPYYRRDVC